MGHEHAAAVSTLAYRAAVRPELWPEALARLGGLLGSDLTLWEEVDAATGGTVLGFNDQPQLIAASREAFENHYQWLNIRVPVGESLPVGTVFTDDEVGDESTLEASEYYTDFLRPFGLRYFIGVSLESTPRRRVRFSVQRAPGRGRAPPQERRTLERLLPDLSNAFQLWRRLSDEAAVGGGFAAVFDQLTQPLALLDAQGNLHAANRAMRALLADGRLVRSSAGVLAGATPAMRRALCSVLRRALSGPAVAGASATADGDAPPVIVRAAPLDPDAAASLCDDACVLLMIDDPFRLASPKAEDARTAFDLTAAEAMVAVALAQGTTALELARRLGVSHNTVRSHLAALRAKLGVSSQLAIAAQVRRALDPFS